MKNNASNYKINRTAKAVSFEQMKAQEAAIQNSTAEYILSASFCTAEVRETLSKREADKRNDALRANEDDRRWMKA